MPTSGSWRRYHGYTSKHTNPPILTGIARVPRSSGTRESARRLDRQDTSRIDIVRPKYPRDVVSRRIRGRARMGIRMWPFACHNSARGRICEIPQRKSADEVKLSPPQTACISTARIASTTMYAQVEESATDVLYPSTLSLSLSSRSNGREEP